jgi:hypothetical protein
MSAADLDAETTMSVAQLRAEAQLHAEANMTVTQKHFVATNLLRRVHPYCQNKRPKLKPHRPPLVIPPKPNLLPSELIRLGPGPNALVQWTDTHLMNVRQSGAWVLSLKGNAATDTNSSSRAQNIGICLSLLSQSLTRTQSSSNLTFFTYNQTSFCLPPRCC